jgi:hypothetical protein
MLNVTFLQLNILKIYILHYNNSIRQKNSADAKIKIKINWEVFCFYIK